MRDDLHWWFEVLRQKNGFQIMSKKDKLILKKLVFSHESLLFELKEIVNKATFESWRSPVTENKVCLGPAKRAISAADRVMES